MYLESRKKKIEELERACNIGIAVSTALLTSVNACDFGDWQKAKSEAARGLDVIDTAISDEPEFGKWLANRKNTRKTLLEVYKRATDEMSEAKKAEKPVNNGRQRRAEKSNS